MYPFVHLYTLCQRLVIEHRVQWISFLILIRQFRDSNLGPEKAVVAELSHNFLQLLQANAEILPQLCHDYCEFQRSSLNKQYTDMQDGIDRHGQMVGTPPAGIC